MGDHPRQADALHVHTVADGYVAGQPATGRVHHLNRTAALLFELCDGRSTAADAGAAVKKTFGLSAADVRRVKAALDTLVHNGLVVATASRSKPPHRR